MEKKADRTCRGIVFNIQKYSVNDGPGIRTTVFLKGCPLHCAWCSNPESQRSSVQVMWDQKKCLQCHHCIETCPVHAISLKEGKIIHIDPSLCSGCGRCVQECPGHALSMEGEYKTVEEVMKIVKQDIPFYEESGGGMTLSGGEMLAQPEFSANLFLASKEEGIHTACETTGFAGTEVFRRVIENIDTIMIDVKHWDPAKHQSYTGVTNDLPYENLKTALQSGKTVLPRIPVIPGFNDSLLDAQKLSERLKDAGADQVQLLPFHQFGENKYHLLDRAYAYENVPALHQEDLQDYLSVFLKNGIHAYF